MAFHDYHFFSQWDVQGSAEDVYDLLSDPSSYARWWKEAHYSVKILSHGDDRGVGRTADLEMKGKLPYSLNWRLTCTEAGRPNRFTVVSTGDFVGRGIWTVLEEKGTVHATFDWKIRAEKPLLKYLSFLLKPIFARNHDWVMERGEAGLRCELAERTKQRD